MDESGWSYTRQTVIFVLPGCTIEQDTNFYGNDIIFEETETSEACADLCASTAGGLFWTWVEGSGCWVKNSDSGRRHLSGAVSGNKQCGTSKNFILILHI